MTDVYEPLKQQMSTQDKLKDWAAKVSETSWGQSMLSKFENGGYPDGKDLEEYNIIEDGKPKWLPIMELEYEIIGGDMEGLAAALQDVQLKVSDTGMMNPDELKNQSDHVEKTIEAAASFQLNIAVTCALLVSILMALVLVEPTPHPLVAHWCILAVNYTDVVRKIDAQFVWAISGKDTAEEVVEWNLAIVTLQTVVALLLLRPIGKFILTIAASAKAYGHLMYWTVDLEAKLWYARSAQIQFVQGTTNDLVGDFFGSLILYLFLTRGPIVACAMLIIMKKLMKKYDDFNWSGAQLIMGKHAYRILKQDLLTSMNPAASM